MHKYPSDITREEFEEIREDLEGAKKRTRPRKVDLYNVFCAVGNQSTYNRVAKAGICFFGLLAYAARAGLRH